MIDYTARLTLLMADIVSRVPTLSFIDMRSVLVFARFGRSGHAGPVATCHSLSLPDSEPGYYFWRDRSTGEVTRRSEWFVAKSPAVTMAGYPVRYLISFSLPRFCDQALRRSRKERFYRRSTDCWVAKLDTVVHELYHIDPQRTGIRQMLSDDGKLSQRCHSEAFFSCVAEMVQMYLDTRPDPAIYDFLRDDFDTLVQRHGAVTATTFRNFPSYPQIYLEPLGANPDAIWPEATPPALTSLSGQAMEASASTTIDTSLVPLRRPSQPTVYTEADLDLREFRATGARRVDRPAARHAA